MITSFHLKWRTRKLSRCVKCVLSAHVNLQIMKFGSAEAENSLSLDRATDDCQSVPSLPPPLRVNEWATKILPSSVLRISSATYLTVKSLYLSERIPQRYKFTLPRNEHLFDSFSRGGGLKVIISPEGRMLDLTPPNIGITFIFQQPRRSRQNGWLGTRVRESQMTCVRVRVTTSSEVVHRRHRDDRGEEHEGQRK